MERVYSNLLLEHFAHDKQMFFLTGPRQVGKTTISLSGKKLGGNFLYLNWDNQDDRKLIRKGPAAIAETLQLDKLSKKKSTLILDEIHKLKRWKNFVKGLYDTYHTKLNIIVTGSAKLNFYKAGSDSLLGRYFPYRVSPVSVAECVRKKIIDTEISAPKKIKPDDWKALLEYGGFPEPFLKRNKLFSQRWKQLHQQQLFREDIRELANVREISQLEMLADLLKEQTGQLINYANLANKLDVSIDTIRRWVNTLEIFYYGFIIRPWTKNVSRSLLKNPKFYLWNWTDLTDPGARVENFVAVHLQKAVNYWTDRGFGEFDLHFIRDKEKREVDFVISKNKKAWFLVEVKSSVHNKLSKNLIHFQKATQASHAFQLAFDMPYINQDCFALTEPLIVPAQTLLSQLV